MNARGMVGGDVEGLRKAGHVKTRMKVFACGPADRGGGRQMLSVSGGCESRVRPACVSPDGTYDRPLQPFCTL